MGVQMKNCKDRMCGAPDCLTCHPESAWPRPKRTNDMEDEISEMADALADDRYDRSIYDLPVKIQGKLWAEATQQWHDRMSSKAESLEDR